MIGAYNRRRAFSIRRRSRHPCVVGVPSIFAQSSSNNWARISYTCGTTAIVIPWSKYLSGRKVTNPAPHGCRKCYYMEEQRWPPPQTAHVILRTPAANFYQTAWHGNSMPRRHGHSNSAGRPEPFYRTCRAQVVRTHSRQPYFRIRCARTENMRLFPTGAPYLTRKPPYIVYNIGVYNVGVHSIGVLDI